MVRVTGRLLFKVVTSVLTLVSACRVVVLILEALAVVSDERSQDVELLELCARGEARASVKMRSACLQAQSERAAPLVLKAVVLAVSTAFNEFCLSVNSPLGFCSLVLFLLSSLVLPVVPWIRGVLSVWAGDDEELCGETEASHVVVLTGENQRLVPRLNVRRRLARRLVGAPRQNRVCSDCIEEL